MLTRTPPVPNTFSYVLLGVPLRIASPGTTAAGPQVRGAVSWVRTAAMPQPMSTPTAAGMIARSVGYDGPEGGALRTEERTRR